MKDLYERDALLTVWNTRFWVSLFWLGFKSYELKHLDILCNFFSYSEVKYIEKGLTRLILNTQEIDDFGCDAFNNLLS